MSRKGLGAQASELRLAAKAFERQALRSEADAKRLADLASQALARNDLVLARTHGECVIREQRQREQTLRLASRLQAVAVRVENADRMRSVSLTMAKIVNGLGRALKQKNTGELGTLMDQFDAHIAELERQADKMMGAMDRSSAVTAPSAEVDAFLVRLSEQHGLQVNEQLARVPVPVANPVAASSPSPSLLPAAAEPPQQQPAAVMLLSSASSAAAAAAASSPAPPAPPASLPPSLLPSQHVVAKPSATPPADVDEAVLEARWERFKSDNNTY